MANTYTWDCTTVDVYPSHSELTDVVYNVHWRLTGDDGANTATVIGTQTLSVEDLSAETFTAVADLTNDQVTAWVKAAMEAEKVAELEASVDAQLAEKAAPTSVTMSIGTPAVEAPAVPEANV